MANTKVIVEKGADGTFSAFMAAGQAAGGFDAYGAGDTAAEAIKDFERGYLELQTEGAQPRQFKYVLDIGALFSLFPLNVSATARAMGVNEALMRQYAAGTKQPGPKALSRIAEGLKELAARLAAAEITASTPRVYA